MQTKLSIELEYAIDSIIDWLDVDDLTVKDIPFILTEIKNLARVRTSMLREAEQEAKVQQAINNYVNYNKPTKARIPLPGKEFDKVVGS